jgi:prefoldin subunit 5
LELVDRIESVLKEQVAAMNAKLEELRRAVVSVDTCLGDLKRAFMP